MSRREEFIAKIESLSSKPAPDSLKALDENVLADMEQTLGAILERERAGLDSLFSSMTHTMKYIPNLLLQSLTSRYIEPPIAARICEKLSVKQAVGVANGLEGEYVAMTCHYLSASFSAELVSAMNRKKARAALRGVVAGSPRAAIAVFEHLPQKTLKILVDRVTLENISENELSHRRDSLLARY